MSFLASVAQAAPPAVSNPMLQRRRVLAGAALAGLALLLPALAGAAPYSVTRSTAPFAPLPIGGGSYTNVGSGYDTSYRVNLPFPVRFFDVSYDAVTIGTNGYVTFASGNNGNVFNSWTLPGSSTSNPKDLIALWWAASDCRNLTDAIRRQTLGTAPNRQFVIEWNCTSWSPKNSAWQAQLWFSEGSSTILTHYGSYATPGDYGSSRMVTVGIQNHTATESYLGLGCNKCDGNLWPTNSQIVYSQGPELRVSSVRTPDVAYAGVPLLVQATVQSVGGKPALGFTTRFWVSPTPSLGDDSIPLGTVDGAFDAAPGESLEFVLEPRLPVSLQPGTYYIVAEADPFHVVPIGSRGPTVGVSPPFVIGLPAANLTPTQIRPPERIAPGSLFELSWSAGNIGNADAIHAPYVVVLSTHDLPGPASRVIHEGEVTIERLSSVALTDEVLMPGDVPAGHYYIGVIMDPDDQVFEHEKANNIGTSERIAVVDDRSLAIATLELPAGELGAPYSVVLEAEGGDGIYIWSVGTGTSLPPGLVLREIPAGARALGLPFSTVLDGTPNVLDASAFSLQVESAGLVATHDYLLEVSRSAIELQLTVARLPQASFGAMYNARLSAIGGQPPYTWSLSKGTLPAGLLLDSEGRLSGVPKQDGTFIPTVRVRDALGAQAEGSLQLTVSPPLALTCGSDRLPSRAIGEAINENLFAAGGSRPITWKTRDTRALASGFGGEAFVLEGLPPPGLVLRADGRVTGAPTRAGQYLWTLDVADQSNRQSIACSVFVEVELDRGLTLSSRALPRAIVDEPFVAQLEAQGGNGTLRWSLLPGSPLPSGLSLDDTGRIEGTPTAGQLGGETSKTFAFLVRVADPQNRTAMGSLSITLSEPLDLVVPKEQKSSTGCQAGGAEPGLLLFAAGAGLAALRRRHRRAR